MPVRKVLIQREAVEDVCQDVLIVVAETLDQWEERSAFTTWLFRVAQNKAIDCVRTLRPAEGLTHEPVSEQKRISSLITTGAVILESLAGLKEIYRVPLMLHDIEELSYDEIAAQLGPTNEAVRTRVHRGRAMVAARLAAQPR